MSNNPLFIAITSMLIAQAIKVTYNLIMYKKINIRRFFSPGGMPSSHAALVTGLSTSIGLSEGFHSLLFSICVTFSLIVLYDAAGVRRAVGMQAKVLNKIIDDLFSKKGIKPKYFSELLGHTPLEVFAGAFLGIIIALLFTKAI